MWIRELQWRHILEKERKEGERESQKDDQFGRGLRREQDNSIARQG